jgi:hypothetical protein
MEIKGDKDKIITHSNKMSNDHIDHTSHPIEFKTINDINNQSVDNILNDKVEVALEMLKNAENLMEV